MTLRTWQDPVVEWDGDRVTFYPGTRIDQAAEYLVAQANIRRRTVVGAFNGTDMEAEPGMTPSTVDWLWARRVPPERARTLENHFVWSRWKYGYTVPGGVS